MGADLDCACDFLNISRFSPMRWIEKGREIEQLVEDDLNANKQIPITEEDKLYLEFFARIRAASASFELRNMAIMNAAGGAADPRTGRMVVKDWRAAESLLKMRHPRKYASVKDVPLQVDPIGVEGLGASDESGEPDLDNLASDDLLQYVYEKEILSQRTERTEPLERAEPAPGPQPEPPTERPAKADNPDDRQQVEPTQPEREVNEFSQGDDDFEAGDLL